MRSGPGKASRYLPVTNSLLLVIRSFIDMQKGQMGMRESKMLGDCNRWCFVSSIP
jgi:hypothetical protein